jgi:hypothetical protein
MNRATWGLIKKIPLAKVPAVLPREKIPPLEATQIKSLRRKKRRMEKALGGKFIIP